jgi:periplasmic protein TonB
MIALTHEDRADLLRWLVSGAIILAAHGAVVASALREMPPEDESIYGAASIVMIELQPVVPEPPVEQPEEKVEEKPEPPTDVALLPEPKEVPKPVEEEPPPPPPPTAAPTEGSQDARGVNPLPAWQKEVNKLLEKNKRYPSQVRAQRKRMVARVAFNMDRQGKVTSPPHVVGSSGISAFDQEALELIQRAQPYPPPPAVLPGAEVLVIVPIWFDPPK